MGLLRKLSLSALHIFINFLGLQDNKYMMLMKPAYRIKGWCQDEDKIISELVQKYGTKNWAQIAQQLHLVYGYARKTGKQCRQRWHNHLNPHIVKKSWTKAEEDVLFEEHKRHGNKWTIIADKLPGRTDNSIKNHFYSTVRKSLRRISKFMGSKNSTAKMRQIKPSTLSKIFNLAQKKVGHPSEALNYEELANCNEIASYLMNFARSKLADRKYVMDQEDIKNFQKILQQVVKINDSYENQKIMEAKIKKQKQLEKNFDRAVSSQSESLDNSLKQSLQENKRDQFESQANNRQIEQELVVTRSKRKVKPPVQFQIELSQKRQKKRESDKRTAMQTNLEGIKQEENSYQLVRRCLMVQPIQKSMDEQYDGMQYYTQKENEPNGSLDDGNKFQFHLDLDHQDQDGGDNMAELGELSISPGVINTPMALTPKTYEFMRDLPHQALKNQDCIFAANKIINDIRRNTNELQVPQRPLSILSPSSAFRQYC